MPFLSKLQTWFVWRVSKYTCSYFDLYNCRYGHYDYEYLSNCVLISLSLVLHRFVHWLLRSVIPFSCCIIKSWSLIQNPSVAAECSDACVQPAMFMWCPHLNGAALQQLQVTTGILSGHRDDSRHSHQTSLYSRHINYQSPLSAYKECQQLLHSRTSFRDKCCPVRSGRSVIIIVCFSICVCADLHLLRK